MILLTLNSRYQVSLLSPPPPDAEPIITNLGSSSSYFNEVIISDYPNHLICDYEVAPELLSDINNGVKSVVWIGAT